MNSIVCIGDSLTYGKGWLNGSDLSRTLNVRLAQKYSGIDVVNLGINGNTTGDINTRKTSADSYSPFRIVVWAGINDIFNGVSEATIKSNLQSIYDYYKNTKHYEVWAITITPLDGDTLNHNTLRNTINNWIKSSNVDRVIDAFSVVADPNDSTKRLGAYADPNTPSHINDLGVSEIVKLFT